MIKISRPQDFKTTLYQHPQATGSNVLLLSYAVSVIIYFFVVVRTSLRWVVRSSHYFSLPARYHAFRPRGRDNNTPWRSSILLLLIESGWEQFFQVRQFGRKSWVLVSLECGSGMHATGLSQYPVWISSHGSRVLFGPGE